MRGHQGMLMVRLGSSIRYDCSAVSDSEYDR